MALLVEIEKNLTLASTVAMFGVRRFITAFISLAVIVFGKTMEMTVSSPKSDQPRKESGNQLPHSKLIAKVELTTC